ncbi:Tn7 transposase TnsA N-terminal domain-containing protein [Pandoraea pneumonica]|uniref:Tn7 transposase TnsA N-terminal domain-containing protein n=1 Tax=Pandoraea pneumonica TaxID=2508299 RepID=UPI003CEFD429
MHLFEFARGVTGFLEQPRTIRYQLHGHSRTYTPDFAVDWANGERWLVEVKPAEILQAPENREKFARLAEVLGNQQDKFVILSDRQIRNTVRLQQVKHLLRMRYEQWLDGTVDALAPASLENRTIAQVLSAGASGRAILHRLASREIVCSLDEEITGATRLRAFEERDDAALFL